MSVTTSIQKRISLKMRKYEDGAETKTPSVPPRRASASRSAVERTLAVSPPIVLALLLLVGWYLGATYGHVPSLFLPAPADVLTSLSNGFSSGILLNAALVTAQESILGFLLALIVALPLGYGLAKSRLLAAAVQPYLAAGQAIPAIVIAPLLVIWLGPGLLPNVILDQTLTDAARVEGASGWSLLTYIEFPLALPAVLAGIRTGLTLSVMGAVVGEFVSGGDQGLGALVQIAKEQYDTPSLFAALVILAALAALYYAVSWLLVKLAEAVY